MTELQTIATRFIERSAALGMKGKKRDDAALDYFCGAAAGAELAGNVALAQRIGQTVALIIAVRGYIGVSVIARDMPS